MRNLADTFVDDITPSIHEYNRNPNEWSYKGLVSACERCLSTYSKVINDIEKEYKHLNGQINIKQATDNILKRLSQITTVLNEFNRHKVDIGHARVSFIPIIMNLEKQIRSLKYRGDKLNLTQYEESLKSLKDMVANSEADKLIPKIQGLNNKAKLLQDNIRNVRIQIPNEGVNAALVTETALPNKVEAVSLLVKEKPEVSKSVTFNEQANKIKEVKPDRENYFESKKQQTIPKLQESLKGFKKEEETQHKSKNIRYCKPTAYFIAAIALSALIITVAFLTEAYVILAALIIPAMIGLYGYNECQKPNSNLQESVRVKESVVVSAELC
ncbi:hypothetical protein [Wolbachia endosymbiont of Ctenocephalides felis wCfeT]|uniref:hypothetical protein n=1 Tax=Wolbachia endosymbiont of Ctenocephalides felis wCfeT TaxID=2732593 RepID=UPI001445B590|nr:hypothetical protein [Wolbachia endosymbiont of Ctenocephalides felis wCfeT]